MAHIPGYIKVKLNWAQEGVSGGTGNVLFSGRWSLQGDLQL